jgi:hypothetical protein
MSYCFLRDGSVAACGNYQSSRILNELDARRIIDDPPHFLLGSAVLFLLCWLTGRFLQIYDILPEKLPRRFTAAFDSKNNR